MEDEGVELSNRHVVEGNSTSSGSVQESPWFSYYLDDLLKNTITCTHTHTCHPPGPGSASHTHSCHHTHTQLLCSRENEMTNKIPATRNPRRPLGNREAVRKYRMKKKAQAACLEEEVKKLRILNQHLVRKLQERAFLETEALRLKRLLVDLKGIMGNELSLFAFQKRCRENTTASIMSFKEGESGAQSIRGASVLPCQIALCFKSIAEGLSSPKGLLRECRKSAFCKDKNYRRPAVADCQVSEMATGILTSETFASSVKSS